MFIDAPEMCGGEHNMEYYELFQDYLKVYEVRRAFFFTGLLVRNCFHRPLSAG
jgi:hypothetical protein